MKYWMPLTLGTAIVAATLLLTHASAETTPPGQVDFGAFAPPENGSQFVEVNVPGSLLAMASRVVEKQEPQIAQLLGGLQLIHVNVIGLNDSNREEMQKRASRIGQEMDKKGWERIVAVRQQDQQVSVYLKTLNKDTVQGLVVMVMDGQNQAVFVNVVGNIKPEQLSLLGERLHIDPLKEAGKAAEKAESGAEKQ